MSRPIIQRSQLNFVDSARSLEENCMIVLTGQSLKRDSPAIANVTQSTTRIQYKLVILAIII